MYMMYPCNVIMAWYRTANRHTDTHTNTINAITSLCDININKINTNDIYTLINPQKLVYVFLVVTHKTVAFNSIGSIVIIHYYIDGD